MVNKTKTPGFLSENEKTELNEIIASIANQIAEKKTLEQANLLNEYIQHEIITALELKEDIKKEVDQQKFEQFIHYVIEHTEENLNKISKQQEDKNLQDQKDKKEDEEKCEQNDLLIAADLIEKQSTNKSTTPLKDSAMANTENSEKLVEDTKQDIEPNSEDNFSSEKADEPSDQADTEEEAQQEQDEEKAARNWPPKPNPGK